MRSKIAKIGSTETTVSAEKENDGKLELSDRIALGVGIAVGVPSALAAMLQMWRQFNTVAD